MRRPTTDPRAGFTFAELLVALTVNILILFICVCSWRSFGSGPVGFNRHVGGTSELRLAVEYLLQDLGGAETLQVLATGGVLIQREQAVSVLAGGWTALGDAGVRYAFDGSTLIRSANFYGVDTCVARLGAVEVQEILAGEIHIRLCCGGEGDSETTLVWTP